MSHKELRNTINSLTSKLSISSTNVETIDLCCVCVCAKDNELVVNGGCLTYVANFI